MSASIGTPLVDGANQQHSHFLVTDGWVPHFELFPGDRFEVAGLDSIWQCFVVREPSIADACGRMVVAVEHYTVPTVDNAMIKLTQCRRAESA